MGIEFPERPWKGYETVTEIQKTRDAPVQVIFISLHTSFAERLAAVRAGGIGYFTKPVNIGSLIDKLDELNSR